MTDAGRAVKSTSIVRAKTIPKTYAVMASDPNEPEGEQKSFKLTAQTGNFTLTGQGVACIADSASRVDMSDFSGRASSWIDERGQVGVSIRAAPARGTANEPPVLDVLRAVLATEEPRAKLEGGQDARGEDAIVRFADEAAVTFRS